MSTKRNNNPKIKAATMVGWEGVHERLVSPPSMEWVAWPWPCGPRGGLVMTTFNGILGKDTVLDRNGGFDGFDARNGGFDGFDAIPCNTNGMDDNNTCA